jgi:hypothetical protein
MYIYRLQIKWGFNKKKVGGKICTSECRLIFITLLGLEDRTLLTTAIGASGSKFRIYNSRFS